MNTLNIERKAKVIEHLMEGTGIRASSRLCDVDKNTVLSLLRDVARGAESLHNRIVRNLDITHIEADELHSYVKRRQKNISAQDPPDIGEQWIWVAIGRTSKLIVSYHVGKRNDENAQIFMHDLRARLATVPVLSTDALPSYLGAVGAAFFGPDLPAGAVDYAQVVKSFYTQPGQRRKVKDGAVKNMSKRVICGTPRLEEVGTSYVEREMLTLRTHLRRFIRRGLGHSKKLEYHIASVAVFAAWANLCRPCEPLKGNSPAQSLGLAKHRWSTVEFVDACLGAEPCPPPFPQAMMRRVPADVPARVTSTGRTLMLVKPGSSAAPKVEPRLVPVRKAEQLSLFDLPPSKPSKPLPPKGSQLSLFDEAPKKE